MKGFSSKAQRARCVQLVADGKMTAAKLAEYDALTPDLNALPERLHAEKVKSARFNPQDLAINLGHGKVPGFGTGLAFEDGQS